MKKQSEAEWLEKKLEQLTAEGRPYKASCLDFLYPNIGARRLIAALKRRGWTPPKKGKGKK